jgi:hypothetical protein
MKRVKYRYEEFGEAYLFMLRPIVEGIPENFREEFRSKLIKKLQDHKFEKRRKKDPEHPKSIKARKKLDIGFENSCDPEHVAEAVITCLQGYYLAHTARKIKRYIERNL